LGLSFGFENWSDDQRREFVDIRVLRHGRICWVGNTGAVRPAEEAEVRSTIWIFVSLVGSTLGGSCAIYDGENTFSACLETFGGWAEGGGNYDGWESGITCESDISMVSMMGRGRSLHETFSQKAKVVSRINLFL
jgi:hypothetical protein